MSLNVISIDLTRNAYSTVKVVCPHLTHTPVHVHLPRKHAHFKRERVQAHTQTIILVNRLRAQTDMLLLLMLLLMMMMKCCSGY